MGHTDEELRLSAEHRAETSDRLVASDARSRLVVAGPGTGKTHNFRRSLEAVGGGGLALSFIRALVADLERDLGDLAQVNTFHGYCKHVAHRLPLDGLTNAFDYYPPLLVLIATDLRLVAHGDTSERELQSALHTLDDSTGLITQLLQLGSYYDAVSHADVVYRVLNHLERNPVDVPVFPLVVVDEYQDFCLMETRFIEVLRTASPVLVAGDDDQALYAFKDASAEYIRAIANDAGYERFDLPYCSRCTEVIVDAVNSVVAEAKRRGNLADRIDRDYLCYLPDKLEDSEAHPTIVWAECTVQTKKSPYVALYVADQIANISADDIAESHEGHYPTALVIGRRHVVEATYNVLSERFPDVVLRASEQLQIDVLDGYRRLARDPNSRLGWRIILHAVPFDGLEEAIVTALQDGSDLGDLLPNEYRAHHLEVARLLGELTDGGITGAEVALLEDSMRRPLDEIETALGRDEEGELDPGPAAQEGAATIICTSLLGAKGLSAGYVFIVGFNDGLFPKDPALITDDEICKLIVGLSRTRKECHLVSCGMFGGPPWLKPSSFLDWLGVAVEKRSVNKDSWT